MEPSTENRSEVVSHSPLSLFWYVILVMLLRKHWSPLPCTSLLLCSSVNTRGPCPSLSIHCLAMLLCGMPPYKVKELF
jgi:hypothetical protein